MKLTQVKGNTWVLEGFELIPLYRLENNTCILLDTGLQEEREDMENTLREAGLTPAGILCSLIERQAECRLSPMRGDNDLSLIHIYAVFRVFILGIFQFHNVAVLHV